MTAADQWTKEYLAHRGHRFEPIRSDEDATFVKTFTFDVEGMGPQVACPSNPANLKPVEEVEGRKIDVAFPGSGPKARSGGFRGSARRPPAAPAPPRRVSAPPRGPPCPPRAAREG